MIFTVPLWIRCCLANTLRLSSERVANSDVRGIIFAKIVNLWQACRENILNLVKYKYGVCKIFARRLCIFVYHIYVCKIFARRLGTFYHP